MIGNLNHGWVFICPQKTGSLSMRHWLLELYGGERISRYHDRIVPEPFISCYKFITVRDPYERAYSAWHHVGRKQKSGPSRKDRGISFNESCKKLAFSSGRLVDFYSDANADGFVRLEMLSEDVTKLHFFDPDKPLPGEHRVNSGKPGGGFRAAFSSDSQESELVRTLFAEDFSVFGYQP